MKILKYNEGIQNDSQEFIHDINKKTTKDKLYNSNLFFYKTNPKAKLSRANSEDELKNFFENDLSNYVKSFDTAVDIGARVGEWSRPLSNTFNNVISFEARTKWCKCFLKNIKLKNVSLYNYALGNSESWAKMAGNRILGEGKKYKDVGWDSTWDFHGRKGNRSDINNPVKILKLDSFNIDKIDFMKIDVDGYEMDVLKGGESTILKTKPIIHIECILKEKYGNGKHREYLKELGAKELKEYYVDGILHDILFGWE